MNETVPIKQVKFSGEISPSQYGDTQHPKFPSSLRTCLNWLPTAQGELVKRPGTKLISPVKDASYAPRLVRYVFSDDQAFLLEVGNLYVRFYKSGRYVGNDGALHDYGDAYGGGRYELVTPFTTAMLPYLKFTSVGDVITITYGGQAAGAAALAPRDLRHTSGALTPWTIGATPLKIPITNVPAGVANNIQGWVNAVSYKQGDLATQANVLWVSIQNANLNNAPPAPALNPSNSALNGSLYWMPAVDLAHTAVTVSWVATAVVQDPDGITYETAPCAPTVYSGPLALDRQVPLQVTNMTPALPAGWTLLYYKLYRAPQSGIYGWVMDIAVGGAVVYDDGRSPNYTKQPPLGTDPFLINAADSYPSVVGYLDQRRIFAASAKLPSAIVLSKIGDLYNYDGALVALSPGADTDAMLVVLASEVLEQVRAFVPLRRGLLLTGQGEWAIAGQGGGPISRSSIDAKRQSAWGSSWLNPIVIGTGVLFNTAKSNMVRDLFPLYGLYADIWNGQDLSVMVRHLLDLHTLKDWTFQSVPHPVVWAVRDDGVLLSLTYQQAPPSFGQQLAEGVASWAQHTTGTGFDKFEAICAVPEPPDDALYVVVKRKVNFVDVRYIERMDSPVCPASPYVSGISDVRYGRYSDSVVTYDGHNDKIGFSGVNAVIDSFTNPGSAAAADYAVGSLVKVTVAGGPFVATDAGVNGSAFVLDPENLLGLDLIDPAAAKVVSGRVVQYTGPTQVTIELDVAMVPTQIVAWRAGKNRWAIAKGSIVASHLLNYGNMTDGHQLESGDPTGQRGVVCLADGDVNVITWDNAASTAFLSSPAVVIQLGISYNADVALLDAWHANAEIRNKLKNVIRMGFEVAGTRGMWIGKDFNNLSEWQERAVIDAYSVMGLHTGYFEEFVTGDWNKSAQGVLRHFQPLPAVLSSVLREVRLGDS